MLHLRSRYFPLWRQILVEGTRKH